MTVIVNNIEKAIIYILYGVAHVQKGLFTTGIELVSKSVNKIPKKRYTTRRHSKLPTARIELALNYYK